MNDGSFGVSTLDGTYALTFAAHGGAAPLAAFGVLRFDGAGNVTGSLTESRPGISYGVREIVTLPVTGTYSVDTTSLGRIWLGSAEEPDLQLALRDVAEI